MATIMDFTEGNDEWVSLDTSYNLPAGLNDTVSCVCSYLPEILHRGILHVHTLIIPGSSQKKEGGSGLGQVCMCNTMSCMYMYMYSCCVHVLLLVL